MFFLYIFELIVTQLLTGIETSVIVFHQNIMKESRGSPSREMLFCGKFAFSYLELQDNGFFTAEFEAYSQRNINLSLI